jgi:hypothetical protein
MRVMLALAMAAAQRRVFAGVTLFPS